MSFLKIIWRQCLSIIWRMNVSDLTEGKAAGGAVIRAETASGAHRCGPRCRAEGNRATSRHGTAARIDMLGVFAEFETNLRRERQLKGIAAAKARGVYKGHPAIDAAEMRRLRRDEKLGLTVPARGRPGERLSFARQAGDECRRGVAMPIPPDPRGFYVRDCDQPTSAV
jgi:hypothetical protein